MSTSELADHAWWASFWTTIEHGAFIALIVALAAEFAALRLAGRHHRVIDKEKDLKIVASEAQAAEASARAAEATQKAEEARERVLEAEIRLQDSMHPRTPKQDVLLKALEGNPTAKVQILYVHECADCSWAASWISHWLKEAKWELAFPFPMPIEAPPAGSMMPAAQSAGGQPWGITVCAVPLENNKPYEVLFRALQDSFGRSELVTGSRYDGLPQGVLRIVVGPRA